MITYSEIIPIWESPAEYIVIPVNSEGIAGKGMVLEFKQRFPEAHAYYVEICRDRYFSAGDFWWSNTESENNDHKICFLGTKAAGRNPSKIEYVESGLKQFVEKIKEVVRFPGNSRKGYTLKADDSSYAFPKLGCGLGGLDWNSEVEPLMNKYLGYLKNQIYFHV